MHNEYTPEEILALLENGTSADEIANSFTKALNDALNLQEKKAKEAKAAAEARKLADEARAKEKAEAEEKARKLETAKLRDTAALIDEFESYLEDYYPDVKIDSNLDAESLIKLLDGWFKVSTEFKSLMDSDLFKFAFGW